MRITKKLAAAGVASLRPAAAVRIDGCTDRRTAADPFGCDRWVLTAASGEGPYSAWVEDARVRLRTERVDGYETLVIGTECSSVRSVGPPVNDRYRSKPGISSGRRYWQSPRPSDASVAGVSMS